MFWAHHIPLCCMKWGSIQVRIIVENRYVRESSIAVFVAPVPLIAPIMIVWIPKKPNDSAMMLM